MDQIKRWPSESRVITDPRSGRQLRQVTSHPSQHHHPFFFVPAYDDAMQWLVFISHRTGQPQIFAEERATGDLLQLTNRPDIEEWSTYPSHDGTRVFFTAGAAGWAVEIATGELRHLVDFGSARLREAGMVAAGMGTTALSSCDRWWAVKYSEGDRACLAIIDTISGECEVILQRDTVTHMQFCPDDANLLFYAGPLTDRVWVINRDGTGNRRLYARAPEQWITHESWIPGRRELAIVDWPNGVLGVCVDTGAVRPILSGVNAWHPVSNRQGTLMVADTTFPDIGLQLFDPRSETTAAATLCYPDASSVGDHWGGPFPYADGPVAVYAPQHTHPHPSFSPDGRRVVFTSDRTGASQIYEVDLPDDLSVTEGEAPRD